MDLKGFDENALGCVKYLFILIKLQWSICCCRIHDDFCPAHLLKYREQINVHVKCVMNTQVPDNIILLILKILALLSENRLLFLTIKLVFISCQTLTTNEVGGQPGCVRVLAFSEP